jgi:hypothetical protein
VVFCGPERGGGSRGILWRGGRVVNAAGFKKKQQQQKSVSSVILASEVQILPSPHQLF